MCEFSAPPGYVRKAPLFRPKLGPFVRIIDAILEADVTAPPKQRHTAQRIFERLKAEHGYGGGYSAVKEYVREARTRRGRPLCRHRPSDTGLSGGAGARNLAAGSHYPAGGQRAAAPPA